MRENKYTNYLAFNPKMKINKKKRIKSKTNNKIKVIRKMKSMKTYKNHNYSGWRNHQMNKQRNFKGIFLYNLFLMKLKGLNYKLYWKKNNSHIINWLICICQIISLKI